MPTVWEFLLSAALALVLAAVISYAVFVIVSHDWSPSLDQVWRPLFVRCFKIAPAVWVVLVAVAVCAIVREHDRNTKLWRGTIPRAWTEAEDTAGIPAP